MKCIITYFIFLSSFYCYSTIQYKDILCYDGNNYVLKNYYLEEYFEKNLEKKPKSEIQSSALWRGYVATFTVFDNEIYLTDLMIQIQDKTSEKLFDTTWKSIFIDFSPNCDRFLIDWIDDLVLLPIGEPLENKDNYGITNNQYKLLEIKKGIIINESNLSLKKYSEIFHNKNPNFLNENDLIILQKKLN